MKILIIHTKYKERGGEDVVVESEIQLLTKSGNTVKALYFDNSQHNLQNLLLLPFNIISYNRVIKEIKIFRPDVIHIHNLHFAASFSVIRAINRMKIPMVMTLHNYRLLCPSGALFHNNEVYLKSIGTVFPWQAVKDKVYRNSMPLTFWLAFTTWLHKKSGTFKHIKKYIILNEKSGSLILSSDLKVKKEQLVLKPNFINQNAVETTSLRGNHFLYIGRLSPEKGIPVLMKAFAGNGLALTIIGDGPLRDDVIKQQQQNPLIKWLGYQNKDVIDAELHKCNALIVPSVCYEGMPLTIVEGFAAGTPVITSRMGAMETIVNDNYNGLLFNPNDADNLNRQLHKWQTFSGKKKNEFSRHALQTYNDKYTPQKNLSQLLSIYASAINEKRKVFSKKKVVTVVK